MRVSAASAQRDNRAEVIEMNGVSPAILATSIALTGLVSFSAGFLLSPPISHAEASQPIVDPNAWNKAAPAPLPMPARAETPKCNPWDVSDIAMEAVLDEMRQRGWRPPGYVERAVYEGNSELAAMRAAEAAARSDQGVTVLTNSGITVMSDADAERMLREGPDVKPISLTVETPQPATPSR